ncbi:hypothetical protein B0H11DRAFT_1920421 [Mycena galericulata]|nr:hypothetical protein B0H11DRAFT_1920421 [Mycena galericulata]
MHISLLCGARRVYFTPIISTLWRSGCTFIPAPQTFDPRPANLPYLVSPREFGSLIPLTCFARTACSAPRDFGPARAKIRTSARARKFSLTVPHKNQRDEQRSEIKFGISVLLDSEHIFDLQNSLLNWYFNSIKGAESFIPPQDRTSISSQLGFRGPGHGVEKFSANSEPDSSPPRVGPGSDL